MAAQEEEPRVASAFLKAKLERETGRNWDLFYKAHQTKFFKDRHWTDKEFAELRTQDEQGTDKVEDELTTGSNSSDPVLLEVGCGVGNMLFPLLEKNAALRVHCCDISPRAVDLVKSHPSYNVDRVNAFVHDLAQPKLSLFEQISHHPFGLPSTISVIFVLSAIPPQLHEAMLRSLIECLPQGGSLLLRDYAHGDLAQQRFDTRPDAAWTEPSLLSADKDYYRRGDGTLTYFFKREELVELADRCGLIGDVSVMQTTVTNRKQGAAMERRFVQARWTHRSEL